MKNIVNGIFSLSVALLFLGCGVSENGGTAGGSISLEGSGQGRSGAFVDFDGDGDQDKLVGAPYAEGTSGTGAVLVYNRTPTGYGTRPSTLLKGDDNLGYSMASVGDVDNDGYEDFAVGALNGSGDAPSDPSLAGSVYVYRGGTGGTLLKKLAGETPLAKFGYSIAGGDLDNDGYSDVVVGAPFNTSDPALLNQGAVYIFFGPTLSRSTVLYANASNKGIGLTVETGDMSGDGVEDLFLTAIVTYPVASSKVLGFFGGPSFAPVISTPNLTVSNNTGGFGSALKIVGDIDGDSFGDLAIGAPKATVNGDKETGVLYVLKGSPAQRSINLATDSSPLIASVNGSVPYGRFGYAIQTTGDLDTGGKPDVAVSAPLCNCDGKPMGGKVYFFRGETLEPAATMASATAFDAAVRDQGYGYFLAATGEGYLMIGGPRSNGDTGGVAMVDLSTGSAVAGGSSGGTTGGSGDCH